MHSVRFWECKNRAKTIGGKKKVGFFSTGTAWFSTFSRRIGRVPAEHEQRGWAALASVRAEKRGIDDRMLVRRRVAIPRRTDVQ